jgi:hypothetical protein
MQPSGDVEDGWFPERDRLVLRFVWRATRRLHPAEDCFRGAGYRITPLPIRVDERGREWSGFVGEKNGRILTVRQCVISAPGEDLSRAETYTTRSWPDVSNWYWDVSRPLSALPAAALAVTLIDE